MNARVTSVSAMPDYQLHLVFDNGEARLFDMKPYLGKGVFAALADEQLFRSASISFDTVQWSNGGDLCPEGLYEHSVPEDTADTTGQIEKRAVR